MARATGACGGIGLAFNVGKPRFDGVFLLTGILSGCADRTRLSPPPCGLPSSGRHRNIYHALGAEVVIAGYSRMHHGAESVLELRVGLDRHRDSGSHVVVTFTKCAE